MHAAQGNFWGFGWATLEGRVAWRQRTEQWAAWGRAHALGLGMGQSRRAWHWALEQRSWRGRALPRYDRRCCCWHSNVAPSGCHLAGQTKITKKQKCSIKRWQTNCSLNQNSKTSKVQITLYLLWSEKSIIAKSCRFCRLQVVDASTGGTAVTGPATFTLPNMSTFACGACRGQNTWFTLPYYISVISCKWYYIRFYLHWSPLTGEFI